MLARSITGNSDSYQAIFNVHDIHICQIAGALKSSPFPYLQHLIDTVFSQGYVVDACFKENLVIELINFTFKNITLENIFPSEHNFSQNKFYDDIDENVFEYNFTISIIRKP